jgi:predicted nucleotidyltransferase
MMLDNEIKEEIVARLKTGIGLHKVILFGSFAWGTPGKDSDIDLLVVTDDRFMPNNYNENMRNYLRVASLLRDIKKKIPMDLIVHTKPMHEEFVQLGSMFSKEIMKRGEVLYEEGVCDGMRDVGSFVTL